MDLQDKYGTLLETSRKETRSVQLMLWVWRRRLSDSNNWSRGLLVLVLASVACRKDKFGGER
jgi:hypothetical protein